MCCLISFWAEDMNMPFDDCRRQSYDNGANIKRQKQGVQARLLERNLYVPYGTHIESCCWCRQELYRCYQFLWQCSEDLHSLLSCSLEMSHFETACHHYSTDPKWDEVGEPCQQHHSFALQGIWHQGKSNRCHHKNQGPIFGRGRWVIHVPDLHSCMAGRPLKNQHSQQATAVFHNAVGCGSQPPREY